MKIGKNFSANNLGQRKKSDFYETPYSMTEAILEREELVGSIFEPARGNGAIEEVLKDSGYKFTGSDKDFLQCNDKYDTIITNPPFSLANQFILKAKEVAQNKIILLLPLAYLHGKNRHDEIWTDTRFPLSKVYVFVRYPLLGEKLRKDGKYHTGMMVYAWYVWEKDCKQEPIIKWIDNSEYII